MKTQTQAERRKAIISKVLEQPDAYMLVQAAENFLREELKARAKFHLGIEKAAKKEFINGLTISHPRVGKKHNKIRLSLTKLMSVYIEKKNLGLIVADKMIAFTRNDYQPDLCFFHRNKGLPSKEEMILPPPDLVVEVISKFSTNSDRVVKFKDYEAHKIPEYWIVDPENQTVEQYYLIENEYQLTFNSSQGDVTSFVLEGFKIPVTAIFNEAENWKAIQGF